MVLHRPLSARRALTRTRAPAQPATRQIGFVSHAVSPFLALRPEIGFVWRARSPSSARPAPANWVRLTRPAPPVSNPQSPIPNRLDWLRLARAGLFRSFAFRICLGFRVSDLGFPGTGRADRHWWFCASCRKSIAFVLYPSYMKVLPASRPILGGNLVFLPAFRC